MEIVLNQNKTITLILNEEETKVIDWMNTNNRLDDFILVISKFLQQRKHQIEFEEVRKLYSSLSSNKKQEIMELIKKDEE